MANLQKQLLHQQKAFARAVRRFILVGLAAVVCLTFAFLYMSRSPRQPRLGPEQTGAPQNDFDQPLVLDPNVPPHPSQLIPAQILYAEPHVNPVRRVGPRGETVSLVDRDILLLVLQAVGELSQDELAARVDHSIVWEDFDGAIDKQRREQIRGRICRFRGTLRRCEETKDQDVNVSEIGLEALYEGQLQDAMGRWYSFYCFEKPPRMPGRSEVAELVGVFYKLIKYPTRQGEAMITPLIVARTITIKGAYRPPPPLSARILEAMPPWAFWIATAAFLAAVFGLLTILLRARPARLRRYRRRPRTVSADLKPGETDTAGREARS